MSALSSPRVGDKIDVRLRDGVVLHDQSVVASLYSTEHHWEVTLKSGRTVYIKPENTRNISDADIITWELVGSVSSPPPTGMHVQAYFNDGQVLTGEVLKVTDGDAQWDVTLKYGKFFSISKTQRQSTTEGYMLQWKYLRK